MFEHMQTERFPAPRMEDNCPAPSAQVYGPSITSNAPAFRRSTSLSMFRQDLCAGDNPLARVLEHVDGRYLNLALNPPEACGRVHLLKINDDFQLFAFRGRLKRGRALPYLGRGWLHFCFTLKGAMRFKLPDGTQARTQPRSALLLAYPDSGVCRDMFIKGENCIVSLFVRRSALPDILGIDADKLPKRLQDLLEKLGTPGVAAQGELSKETEALAQQVFDNSVPAALKPFYLSGKAAELISRYLTEKSAEPVIRPKDTLPLTARDREAICQAKLIIDEDMMATIKLPELARKVGLNRSKLSQGFHAHFGITLLDYTISQKMRFAEEYIKTHQGSLGELAAILGYSHPNSLSEAVRKYFGMPPRELARQP